MYERDIDPYEELTDDICNFLEAHPWHGDRESSNLDYEYRANGWVHVPDEPKVQDGPDCPRDALDALEFCGRLAFDVANGKTVSPTQAARAARQAVKCFAYYNYDQQEWFTDALPPARESEPDTGADDKCKEAPPDAEPSNHRDRESAA